MAQICHAISGQSQVKKQLAEGWSLGAVTITKWKNNAFMKVRLRCASQPFNHNRSGMQDMTSSKK